MKHFIVLFMWSLFTISVQSKAAYKLKLTRAEIVRSNKEYVLDKLWLLKPNRYTNAMNGELTVYNVPQDTKVKLKVYEFLSNEYRPFAINLERSLCGFMVMEYKMMIYPEYMKLGAHMPEPRCPIIPGNYSFANYTTDINNYYPSGLPFRNFLLTFEF